MALTRISSEDEAIYQCIAENSAGTNQASARLAVAQAKDLPGPPEGLAVSVLSTSALQITWSEPPATVIDNIIGFVLHIRKIGGEREKKRDKYVQHLAAWISVTVSNLDLSKLEPKLHTVDSKRDSEPDGLELQEAISKGTFQHDVTNLEAATTYSLYLKAYSPLGASQQSNTVVATTLGGGNAYITVNNVHYAYMRKETGNIVSN